MHVVVCVKQVPDTTNVRINPKTNTLMREGVESIVNPFDEYALEEGLRLKDKLGARVTVVTMGPPQAAVVLREALARGADDAVLVSSRAFGGADTLATSYTLSQAIKKACGGVTPDLVLFGKQAIDGDTAQVGPQIGKKLDCAVVTYLEKLEMDGDFAIATRDIGTGVETCRAKLPALFTVTEKFGELRPFQMRRVMKYKKAKAPVENGGVALEGDLAIGQLTCDDIGAEADRCGFAGSPTNVNKIVSVVLAGGDYKEVTPDEAGINGLIGELVADHTIG